LANDSWYLEVSLTYDTIDNHLGGNYPRFVGAKRIAQARLIPNPASVPHPNRIFTRNVASKSPNARYQINLNQFALDIMTRNWAQERSGSAPGLIVR
jgi:hypothetical protein